MQWPDWWSWEIEITSHVEKRMEDRDFNELDLREMLEHASGYHADVVEGRFVVETKRRGKDWEIIVEPDDEEQLLVIVTAYPVEAER